jgi:multiple sugar transport system ATP-binding protein
MILVSHDPTDGMTLADDMIIIKDGRVKERGRPSDIYSRPSHTYTASLLGNAFVLPSDEARSLGLKPSKDKVMIYPEWVQLKNTWSSRLYQVKDVFFKGFYEELLLEREHIKIRALNMLPGSVKKGQSVQVLVSNFLEFD